MNSLILRTNARIVVWLMVVLSAILLIRGHNFPGGGFIGGLCLGLAFVLLAIANGGSQIRQSISRWAPVLLVCGVSLSIVSGVAGLFAGAPFMTAAWIHPGGVPIGTPLLFDVGVFLTVAASVIFMVRCLEDR